MGQNEASLFRLGLAWGLDTPATAAGLRLHGFRSRALRCLEVSVQGLLGCNASAQGFGCKTTQWYMLFGLLFAARANNACRPRQIQSRTAIECLSFEQPDHLWWAIWLCAAGP